MKGDDVGVLDLLQDADLPLDVLAAHAPPAGFRPPFLDEFGSILETGAFLTAFLHNSKLPAEEKRWKKVTGHLYILFHENKPGLEQGCGMGLGERQRNCERESPNCGTLTN